MASSPRPRRIVAASIAALALLAGLLPVGASAAPVPGIASSLTFDGANDYVTFGTAASLGLPNFTIETWFKRTGAGTTTTSGTGGLTTVTPLVAKGRGEAEGSNVDMNYILGIQGNVIGADFEEGAGQASPALNHPVTGTTTIQNGVWYHAAATYDGATLKVYLNGALEGSVALTGARLPRSDSIQHASLGSALTSTGAAAGFFQGELDEARIWNAARTQAQIQDTLNQEVTNGTGLVARWGLNDGTGTVADDSIGSANGTLSGTAPLPVWSDGYPLDAAPAPAGDYAIDFAGTSSYVDLGDPPSLDLPQFTVEAWFKKAASGGATVGTGTGGVTAYPLVTKGMAEAETADADVNYFLGLDAAGHVVADFEAGAGSLNNPLVGTAVVPNGTWHHAAVTYNGTNWTLYLDGAQQATAIPASAPNAVNIVPAGIGTAMLSTGKRGAGFFPGSIDEVRIWDNGRTPAEIAANYNQAITAAPGLVARFGFNEGAGTVAGGTSGDDLRGVIYNGSWVNGFSVGAPVPCAPACGLDFNGTSQYVGLGDPASLDLAQFTIETWFRRDGQGTISSTGTGGVPNAVPLVTHGGAESEGPPDSLNMNWYLGIDDATDTLMGDFEEAAAGTGATGLNHPVLGTTVIPNNDGVWHHAAATYDGVTWNLYLDGNLDKTLVVNEPVEAATTQKAALGSSLDSDGISTNGFFNGALDETRIWNRALTQGEIQANMTQELTSGSGLVARYGLNEGSGTGVADSVGTANGTAVAGPTWIAGAPFGGLGNQAPNQPAPVSPANAATGVSTSPTLDVTVADPDSDPTNVTFYGRPAGPAAPPDFTVVALPDTQHYSDSTAREANFRAQTQWVVDSRNSLNTVFVSHLGDIVEHIDTSTQEWAFADAAMDILDANGVPNNLAPGNHDMNSAGVASNYDINFPPSRYDANGWYGSYLGDPTDAAAESTDRLNKDNYELFEVGTLKFLIIHLEYDMPNYAVAWAQNVIDQYPDRHVIISTHLFLSTSGSRPTTVLNRTSDGTSAQAVWTSLIAPNCNVFLVINGHYPGEANRTDNNSCGDPVHQLESDYQSRANGGDGWLRYMTFEPSQNQIEVYTYSPTRNAGAGEFENDANSRLSLPFDMSSNPWQTIGTVNGVASGAHAQIQWNGLAAGTEYEWYAVASDGSLSAEGQHRTFTTAANLPPTVTGVTFAPTAPTTNDFLVATPSATDPDGSVSGYGFQWQKDTGAGWNDIIGATSASLDLSLAGNGNKGDLLRVIVTATDGIDTSAPFQSSQLTVGNTAPTATVALSDHGPGTNATLTATPTGADADNDTVTFGYLWKVNNAVVPGETTDTLDLSQPGYGDQGDVITVEVTPNDGADDGSVATDTANVGNAAPVISSASITQGGPKTLATLTLDVSASDEDPGDTVSFTYAWERSTDAGVSYAPLAATGSTLDLSVVGNGDKGDLIRAVITPTDGSLQGTPVTTSGVQILNTRPTASVALSPADPGTDATVTATVTASDDDNDTLSYHYIWTVDGSEVRNVSHSLATDDLDLSQPGNGNAGQVVAVEVYANDMEEESLAANDDVTVATPANTPPVLDPIGNMNAQEAEELSFTATATDADLGDTLTFSLEPGTSGQVPAGASITTGGAFTWTPPNAQPATFDVCVSDGTAIDCETITITVAAAPAPGPLKDDFNGDGRSDLLWRHATTGENYLWFMNGVALGSHGPTLTLPNTDWKVVGTDDFNGDTKADIAWRNSVSGRVDVWLMDGTNVLSSGPVFALDDLDWKLVGTGDFDGDGKADLLWRHATTGENYIWFMNGTTLASSGPTMALPDLGWKVVGTGDFNGDGKDDIAWRNASGQVYVWLMDGLTLASHGAVFDLADPNWTVQGTGDYNGNGKDDIVWQNSATGEVYLWLMNGTSLASSGSVFTLTDQAWKVVGTGDYDGNGKADIAWRNASSGEVYVWLMNGTTLVSSGSTFVLSDLGWEIAPSNPPAGALFRVAPAAADRGAAMTFTVSRRGAPTLGAPHRTVRWWHRVKATGPRTRPPTKHEMTWTVQKG